MKITIIAFLSCLLVLCAQGQPDMAERCKCSGWFMGKVNSKIIKAGPFIHQPSVFCPRTEITFITTGNREKCVDPDSPAGKLFLRNSQKKKTAVSRTTATASAQTSTQSTPRPQTTTKL